MGQLLIKDVRIQKPCIIFGIVFIGLLFFALGALEGMPLSVPAAIFSHFLFVAASKIDEKNQQRKAACIVPGAQKGYRHI
ncbi:hypothetical protein ACFQI7_14745 [Paenibacillus allorhizosphaerae]|uniref:Uncharacterized protein n=1 Tax=Paenibacillus allorhizosphaerae TaxID=2849866 RepID=A0ABN7TH16_9BACL|nr:hypothetical protein [Paenibacillus allorhizosphaerae]CAG7627216.1 hypothetical protein PAECIP111802_01330 [Paenibacillus allorhizosphaerae]